MTINCRRAYVFLGKWHASSKYSRNTGNSQDNDRLNSSTTVTKYYDLKPLEHRSVHPDNEQPPLSKSLEPFPYAQLSGPKNLWRGSRIFSAGKEQKRIGLGTNSHNGQKWGNTYNTFTVALSKWRIGSIQRSWSVRDCSRIYTFSLHN